MSTFIFLSALAHRARENIMFILCHSAKNEPRKRARGLMPLDPVVCAFGGSVSLRQGGAQRYSHIDCRVRGLKKAAHTLGSAAAKVCSCFFNTNTRNSHQTKSSSRALETAGFHPKRLAVRGSAARVLQGRALGRVFFRTFFVA